jgi:hypothetical protein
MARNDREKLDDREIPTDRRVSQVKGDIDVSDLDADDLASMRDEDITNLNPDELSRLEAESGVARDTEDGNQLLSDKALHKDAAKQEKK